MALLTVAAGCPQENPAFSGTNETPGLTQDESDSSEMPPDTGEAGGELCALAGGVDMNIMVPQPCGETNDELAVYQHWFKVTEVDGSAWTVEFCEAECVACKTVPGQLVLEPLQLDTLAGPGTCLLFSGRRLGSGDDCSYHAVSVRDMSGGGVPLVLARRSLALEIPLFDLASEPTLASFAPELVPDQDCSCAGFAQPCCGAQGPTLSAFAVAEQTIPVGEDALVPLAGRDYDFWAFDAYAPGECGEQDPRVVWALTASK